MERLGGLLPPMIGVRKRIRGDRGETRIGLLPGWPLRVVLTYCPPFSALVDELWAGAHGSWLGRSTVASSGGSG